jgi:methionyl-tRNA formyltransferase
MAQDAFHKISGDEPAALTSKTSFDDARLAPANDHAALEISSQDQNTIVFFVGTNTAAHQTLRYAVQNLADMGIPCRIILTDVLQKTQSMKEKLARPEVRNFAFFDKLMINHGYKILESQPVILDDHGDLREDLQYSPNQLARFYQMRGVNVTVERVANINDPQFIQSIRSDNTIARAYNVRNMQIMSPELISAFEDKVLGDNLKCQIINMHPADVKKYPGTNTAFYARMDGMTRNIWTFHVIDKGIDTGPIVYTISSALKPGKTLMQDLCSMAATAGDAISNDASNFLNDHFMHPSKPQPRKLLENRKYYSYATHEEYLEAAKKGIVDVNPHSFIPAIVQSHCGSYNKDMEREIMHRLSSEAFDWQTRYMDMYLDTYGHFPPQYDEKNPSAFFVSVPMKPPNIQNIPVVHWSGPNKP